MASEDPRDDEIAKLVQQIDALRAAVARARAELDTASAEERAISARLSALLPPSDGEAKGGLDTDMNVLGETETERTLITAPPDEVVRRDLWRMAFGGCVIA